MSHTKGPWRVGKNYGAVVADHPVDGGPLGAGDVDHYGGYLVAESIAPCNKPIVAAAPELLAALRLALPIVESEHETGERSWLPKPSLEEARALELSANALKAMRAAVAKATGGAL